MASKSEKTIRQIKQILSTTQDYERADRNFSQNSPFSCYLSPRANLYNQYPFRTPVLRKTVKKTKKRKLHNSRSTSKPFLFNNSNSIYHQLSNSAKKAFPPFLNSTSVQTSIGLILDQSDSPNDPITAKQNEIMDLMDIGDRLLEKRFFNRWRQRFFFHTAYIAQKLIQNSPIKKLLYTKNSIEFDRTNSEEFSPKKVNSRRQYTQTEVQAAGDESGYNSALNIGEDDESDFRREKKERRSGQINIETKNKSTFVDFYNESPRRGRTYIQKSANSGYNSENYYDDRIKNGFDTPSPKRYSNQDMNDSISSEFLENNQNRKSGTDRYSKSDRKKIELNSPRYDERSRSKRETASVSKSPKSDRFNLDDGQFSRRDQNDRRKDDRYEIDRNRQSGHHSHHHHSSERQQDREAPVVQDEFKKTQSNYSSRHRSSSHARDGHTGNSILSQSSSPKRNRSAERRSPSPLHLSRESNENDAERSGRSASRSPKRHQSQVDHSGQSSVRNSPRKLNQTVSDYSNVLDENSIEMEKPLSKSSPVKELNQSKIHSRRNSPSKAKSQENTKINQIYTEYSNESAVENSILSKSLKKNSVRNDSNRQNSRGNSPSRNKSFESQNYSDFSNESENIRSKSRVSSIQNSPSKAKSKETSKIEQNYSEYSNMSVNDRSHISIRKSSQNSSFVRSEKHGNSPSNANSAVNSRIDQSYSDYSNAAASAASQQKAASISRKSSIEKLASKAKSTENSKLGQNYSEYSIISANENSQETSEQAKVSNGKKQSRQNSPSKAKSTENAQNSQNYSDYSNAPSIENRHPSKSDRKHHLDEHHSNRHNSPSKIKSTENVQNYSDYSNVSSIENRRSIKSDRKHHSPGANSPLDISPSKINSQQNSQFTSGDSMTSPEGSSTQRSSHRERRVSARKEESEMSEMNESDRRKVTSHHRTHSGESDEIKRERSPIHSKGGRNATYSANTKESFNAFESNAISPIISGQNFDDVVSQIIPDLDNFIEKYSAKNSRWSLDEESDVEFKNLVEKSRYYKSKYSSISHHMSSDDGGDGRSGEKWKELIPVSTKLPNSINIDNSLPELHEFDNESSLNNVQPPLYFNK